MRYDERFYFGEIFGVALGQQANGAAAQDAEARGGNRDFRAAYRREHEGEKADAHTARGRGFEAAFAAEARTYDEVGARFAVESGFLHGGEESANFLRRMLAVAIDLHGEVVIFAEGDLPAGLYCAADAGISAG